MKEHVKHLYAEWSDERLAGDQKAAVTRHLESCPDCLGYFARLDDLLGAPDLSLLPELEADPFLPQRIETLANQPGRQPITERFFNRFRLSGAQAALSAALMIIAIYLGITLGKGLSSTSQVSDEQILQYYSEAFLPADVETNWQSLVGENNGGQK